MTSHPHGITSCDVLQANSTVLIGQYLAEFGLVDVSVQGSKCAVKGRADCRRGWRVSERKPRGVITGYGVRSMRRLRERIAELDQEVLVLSGIWARIGYPDDVVTQDIKLVKRQLNSLAKRFARAYPAGSFIWRVEYVRRKSGEWLGQYVPHFHLLVLGVGDVDAFRRWLASAWGGVIGTSDEHFYLDGVGVDCKRVYGTPSLLAMYVGKYMGKDVEREVVEEVGWVGRFWGVVGRANLPKALESSTVLRGREFVHLRRLAASWLRRRGKSGRNYARRIMRQPVGYGFTLMGMSSDGWRRMVDHAIELAGRGQLVGYRVSEGWEVQRRSRWLVNGQEVWERV